MIIYQVLFRILEHICSFFFLLWAMDMLFRCGDRNRRQTLILFWYLTIVKYSVSPDVFLRKYFIRSTNSSLFVCVANSPWLTNQKIKENRSLSLVEMYRPCENKYHKGTYVRYFLLYYFVSIQKNHSHIKKDVHIKCTPFVFLAISLFSLQLRLIMYRCSHR